MRGVLLASTIVALALCACGTSVSENYINDPPATMAPRPHRSVRIYASGPPARPHMDVAILQVVQAHGLNEQGLDIMLDHLRARAAQMGCDGVVVGGMRERDGFSPGTAFYLLDPGATTLHGTCVVFTDKPSRPAPAPARPAVAPQPLPAPATAVTESSRAAAGESRCDAP